MINYEEYDPKTVVRQGRAEAFLDVWKSKFKYLLLLGVILTLSCAPIITFRYLVIVQEIRFNELVAAGEMTARDALISVNSLQNVYYAVSIGLVILLAVVCAGLAKVNKCLSWKEPTPIKDNFGEGIKENILFFVLCFIINVLLRWANNFAINSGTEFSLWYYLPTAGWYLVALPLSLWFCACTATYKEKLFKTLSNSVKLYGRTMPLTFAMELLIVWPIALLLIPVAWVQIVVPIVYTLIYLPTALLVWTYFTNGVFDKYINQTHFPELVDRGLIV